MYFGALKLSKTFKSDPQSDNGYESEGLILSIRGYKNEILDLSI